MDFKSVPITSELHEYIVAGKRTDLLASLYVDVDWDKVTAAMSEIRKQHPDLNRTNLEARAIYRCLPSAGTTGPVNFTPIIEAYLTETKRHRTTVEYVLVSIAVMLLILLISSTANAQNTVRGNQVVAACGTPPANYPATGAYAPGTVNSDGEQCGAPVTTTIDTAGLATSLNQTSGNQKTQIVDAGGDTATVTGGALDVNATIALPSSLVVATSLNAPSGTVAITGSASDGTTATFSPIRIAGVDSFGRAQDLLVGTNGALVVDSSATATTVTGTVTANAGTNLNTSALALEATLSTLNGKVTAVNTGAVVVSSSALPTGASTSANQATEITSLASIKTNTDPLVTSGGGGYVRQDSTATIAKETGGNLATIAGAITASVVQDNIKNIGGTAVSTAVTAGILPVSGTTNAGTSAANALAIQGITGGVAVPVSGTVTATPTGTYAVNLSQVVGTTTAVSVGTDGAGVQRVAAIQTDGTYVNYADPCQRVGATVGFTTISQTSTGATIVSGTAATYTYICAINLVVASATNVALVAGTSAYCATSIAGLEGGTTAATGWNFLAGSGINRGNGGYAINRTETLADDLCLLASAATQISGSIKWAKAP